MKQVSFFITEDQQVNLLELNNVAHDYNINTRINMTSEGLLLIIEGSEHELLGYLKFTNLHGLKLG